MKKMYSLLLSILLLFTLAVSSCKKKDEPSPDRAPTLNSGVITEFEIYSGDAAVWDLSDKITDPQGDSWSVTRVTSSDASVLFAEVSPTKSGFLAQSISYGGESNAGTATITFVITDSTGATSTFTATVTVLPNNM